MEWIPIRKKTDAIAMIINPDPSTIPVIKIIDIPIYIKEMIRLDYEQGIYRTYFSIYDIFSSSIC